ncbi:MAG TPA: type II secretion system F family protein [Acidimicrobiia bacterium]|nr:type II secretion system F family protein [Acidimicrobiia bacterium]
MPTNFAYKVRDKQGKVLEGTLEAENVSLVADKLRQMGYVPMSIDAQRDSKFQAEIKIPGLSNRVKLKDVAVFSRQFATMINAGLSLLRSLTILADQTENKELARVCGVVRSDVEKGSSLSAAMAKHPKVFSRLYISMIRAGEVSGALDDTLMRLADTIEAQVELQRRVKSAMTYPMVVGVLVLLILTAMILFIVPMFETMYASLGGELPLPTRMLINVSNVVRKMWFLVVGVEIGAIIGFKKWINTEKGRGAWDAIKLKMPVFGGLVHKTAVARFSRTLGSLIQSGVPILESLEIVADTSGNEVMGKAVRECQTAVKQGESLGVPLGRYDVFPAMVVQMIVVGEETGALDDMLARIADFYDAEVAATVEALTSLIEPLLIVFMGCSVGGMVIALYMPMFNIIKLIQ